MQFTFVKSIIIEAVPVPQCKPLEPFETVQLSNQLESSGINLDKLTFKEQRKRVKQRGRKLKLIQEDFQRESIRVHAEIQVLMKLVGYNRRD
jgi:hypothetical protein